MSWFRPWTPRTWFGPWFGDDLAAGIPVIYCVRVAGYTAHLVAMPHPQVAVVSRAASVTIVEGCDE